jgi:hypothetical protein
MFDLEPYVSLQTFCHLFVIGAGIIAACCGSPLR